MLTNGYCLVCQGASENFYGVFEGELAEHVPVVHASVAGCRFVGRVCVGNKNGLLLPSTTTDEELRHIRNALPEKVVVQRVEERLSALGNCIATNDHVALVHTDLDRVRGGPRGGGMRVQPRSPPLTPSAADRARARPPPRLDCAGNGGDCG